MSTTSSGKGAVPGAFLLTRNIFLAGLALLTGGAIYIFLRSSDPLFFQWADSLGIGKILVLLRNTGWFSGAKLPSWVNNALPDGLWAFAYALLITSIWSGKRTRARTFWIASIPVLILGFELSQLSGVVPGTFCLADLAFCTTGLILGIPLGSQKPNKPRHE